MDADKNLTRDNKWLKLLTNHQISEIHQAFAKFDSNNDGHIESRELRAVMKSMGYVISLDQAMEYVRQVDASGNGKIEFDEFVALMAKRMLTVDGPKEINLAFQVFDRDHSGNLEIDEIRELLTTIGDPLSATEFNEFRRMADPDNSGSITKEEFRTLACWGVGVLPDGSTLDVPHRTGDAPQGKMDALSWNSGSAEEGAEVEPGAPVRPLVPTPPGSAVGHARTIHDREAGHEEVDAAQVA